jgi:NADH:ubiquinone reductase (H+-translocating)
MFNLAPLRTLARRPHPEGLTPHVVVVGGGFGGLQAALHLARLPVQVTLIDRRNFHLFQPLAYQVATGALAPAEIAYPLRRLFRAHANVNVLLAEVVDFDLLGRRLQLAPTAGEPTPQWVSYDRLIVSTGSQYTYFDHDAWAATAPNLKTLEGALTLRRRILEAFEAAELEPDPARRAAWLTFTVVGGGPTGVEMAGQIAEVARDLRRDFRSLPPDEVSIILVEAGDRVLKEFAPSLSRKAIRSLDRLGVTVRLGHSVVDVWFDRVVLGLADAKSETVPTRTVVWAAGVVASPLAMTLADRAGVPLDRAGRIEVLSDFSLPGHPEVQAIGDMVSIRHGDGSAAALPGLAPVAMQEGRYAARTVHDRLRGRHIRAFHYHDKGNLATIGRARAVAEVGPARLNGLIAWVTWLTVHLWYLIGFENRLLVVIRWSFSFLAHGRGARLIAGGERSEISALAS